MKKEYVIIYDKIVDAIRVIKIQFDIYTLDISYNVKLDKVHMNLQARKSFMPDLQYLNNDFVMIYNKLIIFPDDHDEFETNYKRCREFCDDNEDLLKNIVNKIRKGEHLWSNSYLL